MAKFSVRDLVDSVVAGDLKRVRRILDRRPELVNTDLAGNDERRALHFAVMETLAVEHDRFEVLTLLLELGLDPDERVRVSGLDEAIYSAGFPLWNCARLGRHAMAELLLNRGANPNAQVYASGSPVFTAYGCRDWRMVELLRARGGLVGATTAGWRVESM
jgi:ankyrin repeat protein